MRLDAHQHFWSYDPPEYGWIDDGMEAIRRDFRPSELEPLLRANGFEGALTVQVRQSLEETDSLLRLAEEHSFIRGVVGWVDLRSKDARRDLERLGRHRRFVGVRHVVQDEPDERFLLNEALLRGVAAVGALDLTYDILVYHRHLPVVYEFVSRLDGQRLVLDHLAKPVIRRGELEPWASWIRKLAPFENLYCKVSGMVTEASWREGRRWKKSDFTPYLDVVLEAFGPRRLLFGSDWPVCTLAGRYEEVVEIVRDFIEPLTSAEKERILGATAVEAYRLEVPRHES